MFFYEPGYIATIELPLRRMPATYAGIPAETPATLVLLIMLRHCAVSITFIEQFYGTGSIIQNFLVL